MYYPQEIVDRVTEANDIVDVIGANVALTRRGSNYVGLCPFHSEKTPSFSVNRNMQIFKCFGCGKAGSVITFLCEYENLTFTEAIKELAERAGITLPEEDQGNRQAQVERSIRERLLEVNKEAATVYFRALRSESGRVAMSYLMHRGLGRDTINSFGLGFAPYDSGLYAILKEKGFSDDILKESGLFSFSEKGVYERFRDRVIFPIMDMRGKVIAFGGRLMKESDKAPKYLNSPETKAFLKGRNLYGYNIAKHTKAGYILLCEGYMDTIALHQAGFDNAVASLGTALTPDQAALIRRVTDQVVITYDQDGAGRKAALRAIPILKDKGIMTKIVEMTPYKDPDEFIKNLGADEYAKRISEAKEAFFFETESLHNTIDADNIEQKTKFDHEIARKIAKIDDELERANYIEAASRKYGIDKKALERTVNRYGLEEDDRRLAQRTLERAKEDRKSAVKPEDGQLNIEKLLVSMLANEDGFMAAAKDIITADDLSDEMCRQLYETVFNLVSEGSIIEPAKIVNRFDRAEEQSRAAEILEPSLYRDKYGDNELKTAFADIVIRVLSGSLDSRMALAAAGDDAQTFMELAARKNNIQEARTLLESSL